MKQQTNQVQRPWAVRAGAAALAMAMAGCSIMPTPVTSDDVSQRVRDDRTRMYAGQEAITGPVTFSEAAARALKYNLDYRLKMMEAALSQGQLELSRFDMLPSLMASAGYNGRNNDQGGISRLIEPPRTQSLAASTSVERSRALADLQFSWNVLDFGASYYRAQQNADQVMIAEERRRKVLQNILQDVRAAYWRALGAQRLIRQMDALMERTTVALNRARQVEQQGLIPQPQALAYQRALLDATTLLQTRRQDLELARTELAALMNIAPGTQFSLADEAEPQLTQLPPNIEMLEDMALKQRPELREEDYRKRITSNDVKRAMLTALPGLSLDFGGHYDSNKYLYNNSWADAGLRLSMNLFRLAAIPAIKKNNEAQQQVDDARRMALSMAVVTQTRVAAQRYGLALQDLDQADQGSRVDQRLLNYAKSAATSRVDSELEVIRNEARALLSQYQRHVAYANAQAAQGRLFNSVGMDIVPNDLNTADVKTLSRTIDRTMGDWEKSTFKSAPRRAQALPAVRLVLDQVDETLQPTVAEALTTALGRVNMPVVTSGKSWRLVAKLTTAANQGSTRRATWQLTMVSPEGKVAGSTNYTSVLGQEMNPSTIAALTQSAIDANASTLTAWVASSEPQNFAANEAQPAVKN